MGKVLAIRMVETPQPYCREIDFLDQEGDESSHSLHYSLTFPHSFCPDFPAYFISRFSQRGEVVLDPFCGAGTTALETALQGRISFASDKDPLSVAVTGAKLAPSDLTEVTLKLQLINLRRPVNLDNFNRVFAPFYDVETYRELLNLRQYTSANTDRASRFIALLALGLLHGNNAGYFSAYSLPNVSLSPEEQEKLNFKRGQSPDYRSLVPRLLRRAASVFRDGIPSVLHQMAPHHRLCESDARDLSFVPSAAVDLVVSSPPIPGENAQVSQQWLRYWFSNLSGRGRALELYDGSSLTDWRDFMNEVLFELARVVRPGGRSVLDLREVRVEGRSECLDEHVSELVRENLSRYWDVEGVILQKQRFAKLRDRSSERDPVRLSKRTRALVLRRR